MTKWLHLGTCLIVAVYSVSERMPSEKKGVTVSWYFFLKSICHASGARVRGDDWMGAAFRTERECEKLSAEERSMGLHHLLEEVGNGKSASATRRTKRRRHSTFSAKLRKTGGKHITYTNYLIVETLCI